MEVECFPLHLTALLDAQTSSYSRMLEHERQRWDLLRAAFILQSECSWIGKAIKHSQLSISSQSRGAHYACLPATRPVAYLEPAVPSAVNTTKDRQLLDLYYSLLLTATYYLLLLTTYYCLLLPTTYYEYLLLTTTY